MAGGSIGQEQAEGERRPLWMAGVAALLTASFLTWIIALAWFTYDDARLDAGHAFEADGMVPPPSAFSTEWWSNAALVFPRIALLLLFYAVPLMAIGAFLERSGSARFSAASGAAAIAPFVLLWVLLAGLSPEAMPWYGFLAPILILLAIGAAGGAAAAAVRYGRSR